MPIESATYINDLNTSNPPASDPVGEAANHLRMLKAVLKNTFPNAVGSFTGGFVPTGGIIMWSGSIASIPSGWGLCNGTTYARADGSGNITSPNLSDRFILAHGLYHNVGTWGGATSVTPTITIGSYSLTTANLPAHNHPLTDPGHIHTASQETHRHNLQNNISFISGMANDGALLGYYSSFSGLYTDYQQPVVTVNSHTTGISIGNTGSGAAHSHTGSSSAITMEPYYFCLAFIMRL